MPRRVKPDRASFRFRLAKGDEDIREILGRMPSGAASEFVKTCIREHETIVPLLRQIWAAVRKG